MVGLVGFEPTISTVMSRVFLTAKLKAHKSTTYGTSPRIRTLTTDFGGRCAANYTKDAFVVRLTGFEPVTIRLEGGYSIQLSYRRISK